MEQGRCDGLEEEKEHTLKPSYRLGSESSAVCTPVYLLKTLLTTVSELYNGEIHKNAHQLPKLYAFRLRDIA